MTVDSPGFNQVDDRSEGSSELKALALRYIGCGKICIVENDYPWYFAVPAEMGRHCHVELCRVGIGKLIEAQCRLVAKDSLGFFFTIPRPQRPKHEVGPVSRWKLRHPVDSPMFTNPVTGLHVIRMGIFGKARRFSLLRREEALLLFRNVKQPSRGFQSEIGPRTQSYKIIVGSARRPLC